MYFMSWFDMVGYTPHKSVAIYPYNSLNFTRWTPTCLIWLYRIPGTGFSSESFSSAKIHFILSSPGSSFCFVVLIPNRWAFMCPSTVGFLISRCRRTICSSNSGHDVYALRFIAAIHVFLTGYPATAWYNSTISLLSIDMRCLQNGWHVLPVVVIVVLI